MLTQRISSSAVCGYSSLSIMFLSKHSVMSRSACGSIHVLTNVARLSRAFPSSMSSSWMIWYALSGAISSAGSSWRGIGAESSAKTVRARGRAALQQGASDASTPPAQLPFASGWNGWSSSCPGWTMP